MSLPRFTAYKESELQWLGSFPDHWTVRPFWTLFRRLKRCGFQDEQLLSVYRDYGVIPKASRDDNFNKPSDDLSAYQLVEPGDLAINKMKAWQGSVAISEFRGIVSPAYFVFKAEHNEVPRYLHYLLRSAEYTAGYVSISKGVRPNQWDLEPQEHSRMPVLLPPREEQAVIAAVLDRETAKIDVLVEEQKRLIDLLKEKRQAVISHAVTKGLNPDAPMRDTGIEWLGNVPKHWTVLTLRHLLTSIEQGWSPECENRSALAGEWGVLKAGCVNGGVFRETENKALPNTLEPILKYEVKDGDILMSRANGSTENVGAVAFVEQTPGRLMLSDKIFRLSPKEGILPQYLALLLQSRVSRYQIELSISGADGLANNLPQSQLRSFRCVLPPPPEQQEIASFVASHTKKCDELISHTEEAVALLQERRTALISAAVTGKMNVSDRGNVEGEVRAAVGFEVVRRLAYRPTFGRVKLQKIIYLAEAYAGVAELGGSYQREAAGPLDRKLIADIETLLQRDGEVLIEQPDGRGSAVSYRFIGPRPKAESEELGRLLGDRRERFQQVLTKVGDLDTKGAEAVATLFAVWNDALLDRARINDEGIITGFLTEWHPEKPLKFKRDELHRWLGWMRRNGIIPTGQGPRTQTGRLVI